jgi:STE24 endopeptidase
MRLRNKFSSVLIKTFFKKHFRLARVLALYFIGATVISLSTFSFYYLRTPWVLFAIVIVAFTTSYFGPLWCHIVLKSKRYKGKYAEKLNSFARNQEIKLQGIYSIESTSSQAFTCGFGRSKSVFYHSNILENHSYDEIEAVMAHELGHQAHGDIVLYTSIVAIILVFSNILNVAIFSYIQMHLLVLLLFCLLTPAIFLPIVLAISRWREGMADQYAYDLLKDKTAFARFLERLLKYWEKENGVKGEKTISRVARLFLSHPFIYERIQVFGM